jgi:hypothetical protein
VIRQGVKNFGTSEDVEADQKDVVGEQHEPGKFICYSALAKGVVTKITCSSTTISSGSTLEQ